MQFPLFKASAGSSLYFKCGIEWAHVGDGQGGPAVPGELLDTGGAAGVRSGSAGRGMAGGEVTKNSLFPCFFLSVSLSIFPF